MLTCLQSGAPVARVGPCGFPADFGFAFEVGARDVVAAELELHSEATFVAYDRYSTGTQENASFVFSPPMLTRGRISGNAPSSALSRGTTYRGRGTIFGPADVARTTA